jgi:hypothetical protein
MIWADRWLAQYAPSEMATVVHEDGTPAKPLIKRSMMLMRNEELLDAAGLGSAKEQFNLPLRRIVDTIHFAGKHDAPPLQLADLCAFILGRAFKDNPVPVDVFAVIWKHLKWVLPIARSRGVELPTEEPDFSSFLSASETDEVQAT